MPVDRIQIAIQQAQMDFPDSLAQRQQIQICKQIHSTF